MYVENFVIYKLSLKYLLYKFLKYLLFSILKIINLTQITIYSKFTLFFNLKYSKVCIFTI